MPSKPVVVKETSPLEKEIERMRAEVASQERNGQFNTAAHEVLRNLLAAAAKQEKPPAQAEAAKE